MRLRPNRLAVGLAGLLFSATGSGADEVRVAVAANFARPALEIGTAFEAASEHTVTFSFGSTGQLYAQITQGAPFDVFLAADQIRAQMLADEELGIAATQFTYAAGRLALFSATPGLALDDKTLRDMQFGRIAIANPAIAPYGAAAVETMRALGVYEELASRIVRGNNVTQTYQFVATGNAEVGFVALSQLADSPTGSHWVVPDELHSIIAQDAILLTHADDNAAAQAFIDFLRGPEAQTVKQDYGYGISG